MRDGAERAADRWEDLGVIADSTNLQVAVRLQRCGILLERLEHDVISRHGFASKGDYDTLAVLRRAQQPKTGRELADASLVTPTAIVSRLTRLQTRSLIDRRPSVNDRRQQLITITKSGIRIVENTVRALDESRQTLFSEFTAHEAENLSQMLRRVALSLGDVG